MSDNSFNLDDPKLTAFVLGELDETERTEFQQQIDANGGLRSAVDELRGFTELLESSLTSEAAPALTPQQRQQVQAAARTAASAAITPTETAEATAEAVVSTDGMARPSVARPDAVESRSTWVGGLVAATLLIGLGCWSLLSGIQRDEALESESLAKDMERNSTKTFAAEDGDKSTLRSESVVAAAKLDADDAQLEATFADRAAPFDEFGRKSEREHTPNEPNASNLATQDGLTQAARSGFSGRKNSGFGLPGGGGRASGDGTLPIPSSRPESKTRSSTRPTAPVAATPSPAGSVANGRVALPGQQAGKPGGRRLPSSPQPSVPSGPFSAARPGEGKPSVALARGRQASEPDPGKVDAKPLEGQVEAIRKAPNAESYQQIVENPFVVPNSVETARSTFSIDVDTGAYSNVRRFLTNNQLPPANAVRVEEMINYFKYDYPNPDDGRPFSVNVEAAVCPWNLDHQLVRIGLKGREIPKEDRPPSNLVFLIDTSGSMRDPRKLPLVKTSLGLLVDNMTEDDRIAIVTYSGKAGLMLQSTSGEHRDSIRVAINQLNASGSTNGGEGIQMAYRTAIENFYEGGTNRVILCTDGDFNVGIDDHNELIKLIEEKRKSNVFLSVCGFGAGNLKEKKLEQIANKGNGTYSYIDNKREADKVFVQEMTGTLYTIAKDVKIQVDFNPSKIGAYRLVGYENRRLANRDFNDDKKDAGEIGAGHRVTALYEIVPPQSVAKLKAATEDTNDPPKYFKKQEGKPVDSNELLTVRLRYKMPNGDKSTLIEQPLADVKQPGMTSPEFDWAVSVAAFGLMLRDSQFKGQASFDLISELAMGAKIAKDKDETERRQEFIVLVEKARKLLGR